MILEILIALALIAACAYDAEWLCNRYLKKRTIVNCDRDPYLLRWYVFKTRYVTLFIHKFVRSDEDRALHDHPWSFLVIPVWRGYIEHSSKLESRTTYLGSSGLEWESVIEVVDVERVNRVNRVLPILGTRYRDTTYRHRVELLTDDAGQFLPAWSLFFHFEKIREWGFWDPIIGFIDWKMWWDDKCE